MRIFIALLLDASRIRISTFPINLLHLKMKSKIKVNSLFQAYFKINE